MQITKICAGIVLFNPDIHRLGENIKHIIDQVEKIFLVNNGSDNVGQILDLLNDYGDKCEYIDLQKNRGIAAALNVIVRKAKEHGYDWVLTLDQDTVCYDNIIENYEKYLNLDNIGQLTCFYNDRNFEKTPMRSSDAIEFEKVTWCITSAALVSVDAWLKSGGADERLFIDAVDFDICLSMAEHGYNIYKCKFLGFLHEIGSGHTIHIGPVKIKTWNHAAFRRYYGTRNMILVAKKHASQSIFRTLLGVLKHMLIILIFENDKWEKLKMGSKGIFDGMRGKV